MQNRGLGAGGWGLAASCTLPLRAPAPAPAPSPEPRAPSPQSRAPSPKPRAPSPEPQPRAPSPYNSSVHRFFAPALDPGDETVTLPKDEAEHLTRVLRIGVGDTVSVFDGRGHEFLARVCRASRRDVQVQLLARVNPAAESTVSLTLAQAVLKGDKMDDVVRDAVMLGAAAIQPIVTRRTETTVGALIRGARPERWRRVALASVKQSKRAVLPEIRSPLTFENYLDEPAPALRLMLVEPGADIAAEPLGALRGEPDTVRCSAARWPRRRMGRRGMRGRPGAQGAARVSRAKDASRGRGPDCRAQYLAVLLGGRGVRVLGASCFYVAGRCQAPVR